MVIHEERLCEDWQKQNTKMELDIVPDRDKVSKNVVARAVLHVMHGPTLWNDEGRTIVFSLNGIIVREEITDKDGRCQIIIHNLPAVGEKATLLVHAKGSTWTAPCKISVDLWQDINEEGNDVVYSERIPIPEEKEGTPAWEKALIGSGIIVALGIAGYLLIKAKG